MDNPAMKIAIIAISDNSMHWYRLITRDEVKKKDIVAKNAQLVYVTIIMPPKDLLVFLVISISDSIMGAI